ncbi:D-allose transporter substrate-binding protein [Paenibacillus kribbensis]|uniref:D-allose transporter substrate-binding protein n=1 Tax=Paenibacillus TaxID=44249 RepID=UPI00024EF872|nr:MULTISPECIES: D-allose transporter substrate-binding protein [Paenibacillus]EHS57777.1 D-allose transporter subunit [Paenibacillus sp. Aloe-11]MEC0236545.1 D-allose transporter substrate-binding protein [Paenibacillus kribbensis]
MKKLTVLLLTVFALTMILAACGNGGTATSTTKTGNGSTAPANEGASDTKTGKPKIAVILKTLNSPFWTQMRDGIKKEADEKGFDVEIFAAQDETDLQGQVKIFEDILSKDFDGVAVAPLTPVNMIPSIVQANNKGIYVVNIDEKINMNELKNAGGYVLAFATSDNEKIGAQGGKAIVDALGKQGGEVAIIEGKAGNASGESRKKGAESAFAAASQIKLVDSQPADWDRQKALDVAANLLQRYPNLKGIYAANDTMALAAQQAVENAGKKDQVVVVGTDGDQEARDSVAAGSLYATIAQDPAQIGITSLNKLIDAINTKKQGSVEAEPETVWIDAQLITKK